MSALELCVLPGRHQLVFHQSSRSAWVLGAGYSQATPDTPHTPRLNTNRLTYLPNKFHLGQEFLSLPLLMKYCQLVLSVEPRSPLWPHRPGKNWTNGLQCQHQRHLLSSKHLRGHSWLDCWTDTRHSALICTKRYTKLRVQNGRVEGQCDNDLCVSFPNMLDKEILEILFVSMFFIQTQFHPRQFNYLKLPSLFKTLSDPAAKQVITNTRAILNIYPHKSEFNFFCIFLFSKRSGTKSMPNCKSAFDILTQVTFILNQFNVFAESSCIAIKVLLAVKLGAFILFCFHFMFNVYI